jgi:hypothetical protein
MGRTEFRVRMEGAVSVVEVRGPLDESAATNLLEFVATAARACSAVHVDLGGIESMTPEAAALLLFRDAPWHSPGARISLRTNGRPGREAVLQAYARRRARP